MDDHCCSEGASRARGKERSRDVEGKAPSLACLPYRRGYRWNMEHTSREQQWRRAEDGREEERNRMKEEQDKDWKTVAQRQV